ncbi:MAG TPA: thioesterase family protein [Candidatus Angelobacter sp.]|nr:thioesterase family protein [Candidatus Angelobacter sp.]
MNDFTLQQKVRFQHCDPAGIVFYPRYFEMVTATVEEWFAQRLGVPFETLHGPLGAAVPTVSMTVEFNAPSRLGDVLEFRLRPARIGRSSVGLSIAAYCGAEKRLSMESTLVFTRAGASKPDSWPEDLRARISREIDGQ